MFIYANQTAQKLFEYSWDEFVGLPSRLSAGEEDREERRILLEGVREKGFTTAYRGPRVARSGRRFFIDEVTVWNLALDSGSVRTGQGALIGAGRTADREPSAQGPTRPREVQCRHPPVITVHWTLPSTNRQQCSG